MKSSFKIFSFFLFLSMFQISCYECCNGKNYQFRVRLEIIMLQNDTLQFYYLTKNSKDFFEDFSLKLPVKGSLEKQFIEFCLQEEPIDLRIYFQKKTLNKNLKILSALFENQESQMFIQGDMFHLYFIGNENIKYNKQYNLYNFQASSNKFFRPFIGARKIMKHRLENRLKKIKK